MKKNEYDELRAIQQERFNKWTDGRMFFAFNKKQFAEGMESFGLDPEADQDKIASVPGGGYIRKTDSAELFALFRKSDAELQEAISADPTGEGFIYQMFYSELANHEYSYTGDITETLEALGMTAEEIDRNTALSHGLAKAAHDVMKNSDY